MNWKQISWLFLLLVFSCNTSPDCFMQVYTRSYLPKGTEIKLKFIDSGGWEVEKRAVENISNENAIWLGKADYFGNLDSLKVYFKYNDSDTVFHLYKPFPGFLFVDYNPTNGFIYLSNKDSVYFF